MIVTLLSILLSLVFFVLSGIHIYWLFGGKKGLDSVLPTKENQDFVMSIPPIATLLSGLALFGFAFVYIIKSDLLELAISENLLNGLCWVLPVIFILRAIGDFNYLGFFKKVKNTKFAKADSKLFAPLCLGIGIVGLFIQLFYA